MVFFLTNYLTVAFPCAQELTELDLSLLWSKRGVKNKLEKAPAPPGLAAAAADEMPMASFSKWPVHSGPTVLDFTCPPFFPTIGILSQQSWARPWECALESAPSVILETWQARKNRTLVEGTIFCAPVFEKDELDKLSKLLAQRRLPSHLRFCPWWEKLWPNSSYKPQEAFRGTFIGLWLSVVALPNMLVPLVPKPEVVPNRLILTLKNNEKC